MPAAAQPQLLVLQPTPYCNLDCSYCYLPHRHDRRRMSDSVLDAVGRHILAPAGATPPTVVWHGGEPMTLPPDWYAAAFTRLQQAAGRPLNHAFQTNAVGVDARWIALWRAWNVQIGVSLDGPARFHDARRRTRSGQGSHRLTMAGIAALQAADLPFHVLAVLTRDALDDPDGIFDFFAAQGLRDLAFNVEEQEGQRAASSLENPGAVAAYRRFLGRFLDRMAASAEPIRLREHEAVLGLIRTPHRDRIANAQVTPLAILSVGVDGTLSTFSPEFLGMPAPGFDDFGFGNVLQDQPQAILQNPAFQRLHAEIERGVEACAATCRYFEVCGGGAPVNKVFELGSCAGTETTYCRLTVMATLDTVLDRLERARDDAA